MRRDAVQIHDLAENRLRRRVALLHARGPRLVAELLAEVARDRLLGGYLDMMVERYLGIDEVALDVAGGRELPAWPIGLVPR